MSERNWNEEATRYETALDDERAEQLAQKLGVDINALREIRAGWDGEAFAFPEVDETGSVVGIGRRFRTGAKGFHGGGSRGLVVPTALAEASGPVLVVEGPSDVAAARSREIASVGRSGKSLGREWLRRLAAVVEAREILIIGENDANGAGQEGAAATARDLAALRRKPVAWSLPPSPHNDLREWLTADRDVTGAEVLAYLETQRTDELPPDEDGTATAKGNGSPPPAPRPFGLSSTAEPFPVDVLPEPIAALVREVSRVVQVDPTTPALIATTALSAVAGNAFRVRVSRSHVEPSLSRYIFCGQCSGSRKSGTKCRVCGPLDQWAHERATDYAEKARAAASDTAVWSKRADRLATQAAAAKSDAETDRLRKESEEARARIPPVPRPPTPYVGDVTSEALTRELVLQGGATAVLCSDARGLIDNILGRYRKDGGASDEVYLKAHGGDRLDRLRVGSGQESERVSHPNPALALCALVQPDKLAELVNRSDLLESGFLARCTLAMPPSMVGTRFEREDEAPPDPGTMASWGAILVIIYNERWRIVDASEVAGTEPIELALSGEARALRLAFANELEARQADGRDLAGFRGFASKAAGEAARLAALLHLAEMAHRERIGEAASIPISADLWRTAEACQRWALTETLRVIRRLSAQTHERRAANVLAWAARDPATRSQLTDRRILAARLPGIDTKPRLLDVMSQLEALGWVTRQEQAGQRRSVRWEVHPTAFSGCRPWEPGPAESAESAESADSADLLSGSGAKQDELSRLDNRESADSADLLSGSGAGAPKYRAQPGRLDELTAAIDAYREDHPIVGVLGGDLHRTSGTNGGEWHGPCPRCGGGDDRLRAWPTPATDDYPRATCRQCGHPGTGDALDWAIALSGVDASEPGARARYLAIEGYLMSRSTNPKSSHEQTWSDL
ncbi:MAG: hypothetical protein DHS20C21_01820 [Gemmatimonadota bacterium]|nr:MAG: hypothetical protein DHS20C21_01820 [Gemmatimonadota bacterium]